MNELLELKDTKDFQRDIDSKALLFTNRREQQQYLVKKKIQDDQMREKEDLNNRVNRIEGDLSTIKNLLLELLNKENRLK